MQHAQICIVSFKSTFLSEKKTTSHVRCCITAMNIEITTDYAGQRTTKKKGENVMLYCIRRKSE